MTAGRRSPRDARDSSRRGGWRRLLLGQRQGRLLKPLGQFETCGRRAVPGGCGGRLRGGQNGLHREGVHTSDEKEPLPAGRVIQFVGGLQGDGPKDELERSNPEAVVKKSMSLLQFA